MRRKRRLRRRAQDDGRAIVAGQLIKDRDARAKQLQWQGLRLIEDDDTPCDVVQLPALAGSVREQALEKLYSGRDDDRRVPVLRRKTQPLAGLQTTPAARAPVQLPPGLVPRK